MLRKRSRAGGGKQILMSDLHSPSSSSSSSSPSSSSSFSIGNYSYQPSVSSSVFTSPRFSFMNFSSILENKNSFPIGNLLSFTRHLKKPPFEPSGKNGGSRAVGLGIVDDLNDEEGGEKSTVLFGSSKLKIQVPSVILNRKAASVVGSLEVPTSSPIEFGIKNRDSQLALLSPSAQSSSSPQLLIERISASEMELSEDYTCVIIHGPNPKTTHIFDNCILESHGDGFVVARKENSSLLESESYPMKDFSSYCDGCKKKLGQGKDYLQNRGEKAFCSNECRHRAMLFDE